MTADLHVVRDPEPTHDVALLDLSYLHRRAWHGSANEVTSMAYTETIRACHAWRELATHVLICLDSPPYRRAEMLPTYKAQRTAAPQELKDQLRRIIQRLKDDGFPVLSAPGYEADDVIATACKQLDGRKIVVVTGDKDALQLVGAGVQVADPSSLIHYDTLAVVDRWGVQPAMIPELLALMGDKSDNIPGVHGIGEKIAADLLNTYGSLEMVLANTHDLTAAKRKALEESAQDVRAWLHLTRLETDAPIDVLQIITGQGPKENPTMTDTHQQPGATPAPGNGNGNGGQHEQRVIPVRYDFKAHKAKPKTKPPPRIIIYGEPGIGKTTFGVESPAPVLIPTEDGALAVDVPRVPVEGKVRDWPDLIEAVKVIATVEHDFKNVILDTFNGAWSLCAKMVCDRDFDGAWSSSKGDEGYNAFGKGDLTTAEEFKALLAWLDICQQRRGMGVILLAHVGLQKQGNALGADFQKFTADVGKKTWAIACAWADQVGHAHREFRAATIDKEKKAKASAVGQERWLVFDGGPARDAKSRVGYEMPERILFSYEEYDRHMKADRVGALVAEAYDLVQAAAPEHRDYVRERCGGGITHDTLRAMGASKLTKMIGWLMANQQTTNSGQHGHQESK